MARTLAQLKLDAKREGWADWIRSDADEHAVLNGCWFDVQAAQNWVDLFQTKFVFTRGPRRLQSFELLDWQRDNVIMPLFGWKRSRENPRLRRYTKGDIFVGKKNGKSTLCGAICDAFLYAGPPRTEVYGVAHSTEQAGVIYGEAAAFAKNSPALQRCLKPLDSQKRIIYEANGSFYKALAGENGARSAEGIIPTLILFDEIHVQRDRALYDALAYACIATENSLFLSVSTVGVHDETQIWWEQYAYAKNILDGVVFDDARFAYIAQADEGCKDSKEMRADPAQWRKALPALGVTIEESKIRESVLEAENAPDKLNNLLRYVFNIPTAQVSRVIPMDRWAECAGDVPDLTGAVCFAGLDVASHEDLTALCLFFPPLGERKGYLMSWFWCPEEKIREREQKQMAHYGTWAREGFLQSTSGNRIDHKAIEQQLRELHAKYRIKQVLFDQWGAEAIVNALQFDMEFRSVPQGKNGMAGLCKSFLDALNKGQFIHDGNPVMTWCCSNTAAQTVPDAMWFCKKKSAEKIDGAIAAAMAIGAGMVAPQESYPEFIFLK